MVDLSVAGLINNESRRYGEARISRWENSTDTRPRAGRKSATTVHVSDSAIAHGNERQDMALAVAGRCVHGGSLTESVMLAAAANAGQWLKNHATMTSTTKMTS